jgi:hypothetical protein
MYVLSLWLYSPLLDLFIVSAVRSLYDSEFEWARAVHDSDRAAAADRLVIHTRKAGCVELLRLML